MIGIFNDCFPPIMDGVSVTTQNYARWLNRKCNDVCVVTPSVPGTVYNEEFPVYDYFSLPIPMRKPYRMGFPRVDFPFRSRINKIDFSLVHAHSPFSSGKLALKIAREQGIPLVATFHSKYRADFERAIPSKPVVDYLIKGIVDFYNQADEVWIPQAAVEETLREYGYKGRVVVMENGNDMAQEGDLSLLRNEGREMLDVAGDEPMLLFVGQHIYEKNPDLIIRSLSKMRDSRWRMFFVGTGYAADELKKLVCSKGLDNKITFLGQLTDREKLKRCYAAADLFLFPSLYDNAPLVVREAAAMQTPSLLASGSTASEIISDNVNGFLCKADEQSFAKRLQQILDNGSLRETAGWNARNTIARSWKDIADEVYDRYLHLIRRHNFTLYA
ncbi:MAG: glycosyltransferase [Prevotellaceae bacterium]|nr:glycosyltransferase [Prevotellaceae bacterium]